MGESVGQKLPAVVDSMVTRLHNAKDVNERFSILSRLARVFMTVNPAEADKYGDQLIEVAESTREKRKMFRAFMVNGDRFSFLAGRKDNINKSIGYYEKALDLARRNNMDTGMVEVNLALSVVSRYLPDYDKAMNFCNQANSYNLLIRNDSITAEVHLEYGSVYIGKDQKILAFKSFLAARRLADEQKNKDLLLKSANKLAGFYASINDYQRAIDYKVEGLNILQTIKSQQTAYTIIQQLTEIGDLYSAADDYHMASVYYEKSLKVADSIKYEPIKAMGYRSIIYNYINAGQPQKALDYFNSHPSLSQFLQNLNFGHFVDQSYGYIFLKLGKYDSAKYYYSKVTSFFENDVNLSNKYSYYFQMGLLYSKTGETDKAVSYFLKAKQLADEVGSLDQMSDVAVRLDSVYQQRGDYKQAMFYGDLNSKYKDSLNKLGREKELLKIAATDEQMRMERARKEQEEVKRRKNNIQYIAIIFGIVLLFITLVVLGMFKVSAGLIKAIGFFVFLMLFEFIFLVFKKNIYSFTQGEPWKDLAFMIGLAALLVPLHHWLEHKVLHYLTSHNRLTAAGHHFRTKILGRSKKPAE